MERREAGVRRRDEQAERRLGPKVVTLPSTTPSGRGGAGEGARAAGEGTTSGILEVRLFGPLELRLDGAPLERPASARAESLLAYLVLHGAPQPRERIAYLFWPDSTEAQARTNLRHLLHGLRRALPGLDRFVEVGPRTVGRRAGAPLRLDVAAFEEAVSLGERDAGPGAVAALQRAIELYRGELLEGSYEEWVVGERERLNRRHLQALERLVELLEARGEQRAAVPYAERLVEQDPLREESYRLLMRLHDARGDRAAALRVYHSCAATLARDLGTTPSAATRRAYDALLAIEGDDAAVDAPDRGAGAPSAPPLIGRAGERTLLTGLWAAAGRHGASMVLVDGEAGVGKTRLVEEFRRWCARKGADTAFARSYPAEGALAYAPVTAWLRATGVAGHLGRLDPAERARVARLRPELATTSVPVPGDDGLADEERRTLLFEALARALLAGGKPLLLVADDLHWADRDTLQFVHFLLRETGDEHLVVAATARLEELDDDHPLRELLAALRRLERVTEIRLERLSRTETRTLAESFLGRVLEDGEAERLFAHSEGSPLFVVEALRAGWDGRDDEPTGMTAKVHAVIESRLAPLSPPARDVVAIAATIGREFTTEMVAEASGMADESLVAGIDELWRRHIVREHGAGGYDFTHERIRDVAYQQLGPARRRRAHLAVAGALERLHADDASPVAAQLAAHYERAGVPARAASWYRCAAEAAQHVHATAQARRHLERALELVAALPATPGRRRQELELLTSLVAPLGALEGYGSPRVVAVQGRALELGAELRVDPTPPLLRSVAVTSLSRGRFEAARDVGDKLQARGRRDDDHVLLVEGHYVLGVSAFWRGELAEARLHFEEAVEKYRAEHRAEHLVSYGLDPQVVCLSRLGNTLWFLGHPRAALGATDAGLALAVEAGHPTSHGTALVFAALLSLEYGDDAALRRRVAALEAWCHEHEAKANETIAKALAGYIDVLHGDARAGLAHIGAALDESMQGAFAPGLSAGVVRVLLQACVAAGEAGRGLDAADLALTAPGGATLWNAEAHRLRAHFLGEAGANADEVEAELARARETARRQGAVMLEVRAASDLLARRREEGDARAVAEATALLGDALARLPEVEKSGEAERAASLLASG